jgi:hypothetical protein
MCVFTDDVISLIHSYKLNASVLVTLLLFGSGDIRASFHPPE